MPKPTGSGHYQKLSSLGSSLNKLVTIIARRGINVTETLFTQQTRLQDILKVIGGQGSRERLSVAVLRASKVWDSPYSRIRGEAGLVRLGQNCGGRLQGSINKRTTSFLLPFSVSVFRSDSL